MTKLNAKQIEALTKADAVAAYEAKIDAKRERVQERADAARQESERLLCAARDEAQHIPLGQPIQVGHHSEAKHRRDLDRIDNKYRKGFEAFEKAERLARKAQTIGTGGISGDDPEAVEKLEEQLLERIERQECMKADNADARKAGEAKPWPSYALRNNNANIRRLRQRIADLQELAAREPVEIEGDGFEYVEDLGENRIFFYFDDKPADEIRAILKREGFKWSRYQEAWTRKITKNALHAGAHAREQIESFLKA